MNIYHKYYANVFIAKCDKQYSKGDIIQVDTRYGKSNDCVVFNLIKTDGTHYYYSIVREDGFNVQEYAKQKAERYKKWSKSAEKKSEQYYEASKEGKDFLMLGEPIKVGHHSEKRHRALIERNWNRMGKSVELDNKAKEHISRAEYWEQRANIINLSMPESLEYFEYKLQEAKDKHEYLKENPSERIHSLSLPYAKKEVNDLKEKLTIAVRLWGSEEEINQLNIEKQEEATKKATKNKNKLKFYDEIGVSR